MVSELEKAVFAPVRLPAQLPVPATSGAAAVGHAGRARRCRPGPHGDAELDAVAARTRQRGDAPEAAAVLPYGGPQHVIVAGFTTAAEQGLKTSRRNAAREVRPGSEVFQTLCGMMATGARTIVLSRWRTGGRTNLELVREFVRELPQLPATEAWQRARLLRARRRSTARMNRGSKDWRKAVNCRRPIIRFSGPGIC